MIRSIALTSITLLACGGVINGADGGVDAAEDAISTPDAIISSGPCPSSAPMNASTCSDVGVVCEYGTSWSTACNTLAECQPDHTWQVQAETCGSVPCPQSIPMAGSDCMVPASCDYMQGHCICVSSCGGVAIEDAGTHWACNPAPMNCPYPRPDLGTPCTSEGQMCAYDVGCCGGEDLTCTSGIWRGIGSPLCP